MCGGTRRRCSDAPALAVGQVVLAAITAVSAGGRAVTFTCKAASLAQMTVRTAWAGRRAGPDPRPIHFPSSGREGAARMADIFGRDPVAGARVNLTAARQRRGDTT